MQKRIGLLVAGFLFPFIFALGNCPDRDSLWKKLIYLRDSSTATPASQLQELLQYEKDIQGCPDAADSTHALLLQRIGATYSRLGDYIRAVHYARQSILLISSQAGSPAINVSQNIRNYYLLYVCYEALNHFNDKMDALDSIITISIRTKSVDRICLMGIYKRVEYFYDVGDFQRCINYISMGESVTRRYVHGKDSVGYIFYFLSRNVWIQIILDHFDYAKQLLANKEVECRKLGAENCLGTIYNQLAEVEIHEKEYNKALQHYQQAIKFEQLYGGELNCKEILNNIGN
ncbi:MAG TPA: tetratricopeptide repeat protein, partial [Puia sp.]|nr:tetratricopeptide repeat protein [Puia sp.]